MGNANNNFNDYEDFDLPDDFPMDDCSVNEDFNFVDDYDNSDFENMVNNANLDDEYVGNEDSYEDESDESPIFFDDDDVSTPIFNNNDDFKPKKIINLKKDELSELQKIVEAPIFNRVGWRRISMPLYLKKNLKGRVLSECSEVQDFVYFNAEVYSCRGNSYHINHLGYRFTIPKLQDKAMPVKVSIPEVYPKPLNIEQANLYTIHCGYKYKLLAYDYSKKLFLCKRVASMFCSVGGTVEKPLCEDAILEREFIFSLEGETINLWNNYKCITTEEYPTKMFGVIINLLKNGFPASVLNESEAIVKGVFSAILKPKKSAK